MPIQAPQWTEFLTCPVCCHEYDASRTPISLACAHTICKLCLSKLHRKQCPFDQTRIHIEVDNLPINYALLQLVSCNFRNEIKKSELYTLKNKANLSSEDFSYYLKAVKYIEDIALFLKPFSLGGAFGNSNVLSRPMQRKLVMLINCQLLEEEGRLRALKSARSLGERAVTELIIQHQNPQQLSTNLWAAIRTRGCQFLGPAMQEEVLKLILLALEDGSALSRKVLVMFVVQRLEPHFPQASKTSIGHVVQLLYRASCFVVSKRESDSSLMKLKEEFRTYDALRREHDMQIVEIANEAGLRIAPDQWSALLYGDTTHKSHMQSIIDKLQTPQSFVQSVQELVIALQRTADTGNLFSLTSYLEHLASIDTTNEHIVYSWEDICKALEAAYVVVNGLVNFTRMHGTRKNTDNVAINTVSHGACYKISLCRDLAMKGACRRGSNCTFAHSEEELVKYRTKNQKCHTRSNKANTEECSHDIEGGINVASDKCVMIDTSGMKLTNASYENFISNTESVIPESISPHGRINNSIKLHNTPCNLKNLHGSDVDFNIQNHAPNTSNSFLHKQVQDTVKHSDLFYDTTEMNTPDQPANLFRGGEIPIQLRNSEENYNGVVNNAQIPICENLKLVSTSFGNFPVRNLSLLPSDFPTTTNIPPCLSHGSFSNPSSLTRDSNVLSLFQFESRFNSNQQQEIECMPVDRNANFVTKNDVYGEEEEDDGIVTDIRKLKLRLEYELEEEKEKLWTCNNQHFKT